MDRLSSVNLSRIRCGNSDLNANLHRRNLCDSPLCACGTDEETESHYLLECPLYARLRADAILEVPVGSWNTRDLLHGSKIRYTEEENRTISMTIQKFISSSRRFDN